MNEAVIRQLSQYFQLIENESNEVWDLESELDLCRTR